jgi:hypothetical protein
MCDALCELPVDDQVRALEAIRVTLGLDTKEDVRRDAAFQKLLQIGSVVAARLGDENAPVPVPIMELFTEFCRSIGPDQLQALSANLDANQKILFLEILNMVKPWQADEK